MICLVYLLFFSRPLTRTGSHTRCHPSDESLGYFQLSADADCALSTFCAKLKERECFPPHPLRLSQREGAGLAGLCCLRAL